MGIPSETPPPVSRRRSGPMPVVLSTTGDVGVSLADVSTLQPVAIAVAADSRRVRPALSKATPATVAVMLERRSSLSLAGLA